MPNAIKYKTGNLTGSLQKGTVALGIDVLGPTSNTGWYSGVTPEANRYVVYKTSLTNTPRIFYPADDTELINLAKQEGATGNNTGSAASVLSWMASQTNLLAVNKAYPNIVTNGSALILDAGFVGSYPTTASTWYDISGNDNNGSLINGPTFDSVGAIVLDGVDDYITAPSSSILNTLTAFTYTALLNISSSDTYGSIIARNTSLVWYAGRSSVTQRLFIGGISTGDSNTFLPSNKYTYICVTWDGTTIRYYFNGVPDGTATNTSSAFNTTPISIGRFQTGEYFQGKINNVGIYNRALSQTEILQNYYQGPIVTNGLVLALDANNLVSYESGSTTAYSLTGSASGSLVNGTGFTNNNGGAWNFDGIDDYITLGTQTLVTNDFSLNIWFNSTSNVTKEHFIISLGYSDNPSFLITQDTQNSGESSFQAYYSVNGVVTGRSISTSTYPNTSIINLCFVRQNGVNTPYINGVPQTAMIFNESVSLVSSTYVLGWAIPRNKSTAYMQGNIYNCSIYNQALTAAEVQQNFNAQRNRFNI
jgi:hypothetical protein